MSLADLLKGTDIFENEGKDQEREPNPNPPYTIHTLIGDIRRQLEGGSIKYTDYKLDEQKCLLLIDYYKEKEGKQDG